MYVSIASRHIDATVVVDEAHSWVEENGDELRVSRLRREMDGVHARE